MIFKENEELKRKKKERKMKLKQNLLDTRGINSQLFEGSHNMKALSECDDKTDSQHGDDEVLFSDGRTTAEEKCYKIQVISRVIFPLTFLVFNGVYWWWYGYMNRFLYEV